MDNHQLNILTITTWNPDTLPRKRTGELETLLATTTPDVLLLQETGWKEGVHHPTYSNYAIHRADREGRGGGCAVLVRSNIPYTPATLTVSDQLQYAAVTIYAPYPILVASVYIPTGKLNIQECNQLLNGPPIIMGGDLNGKHVTLGGNANNVNGSRLQTMMKSPKCNILLAPSHTHAHHSGKHQPSILDYFITNLAALPTEKTVFNFGTSDHLPYQIKLPISTIKTKQPPILNLREDTPAVAAALGSTDWEEVGGPEVALPDIRLNQVIAHIQATILNNTSVIKTKHRNQEFLDKTAEDLLKRKRRAHRQWSRRRDPDSRKLFNAASSALRRYLKKKRATRLKIRAEKALETPTRTWQAYRRATAPPPGPPPLLKDATGHPILDAGKAAEALAKPLAERFQPNPAPPDEEMPLRIRLRQRNYTATYPARDSTVKVTPETVQRLIKQLPNKKAPGQDGVKYEHLKLLPPSASVVLADIFTDLLQSGDFPDSQKQANVRMIPKPGKDPTNPCNYRPISLLNTISKLLEGVIYEELYQTVTSLKLIPRHQFGFRKGRSTVQQVTRAVDFATKAANRSRTCVAALFDVEAAFDRVPHDDLLIKLSATRIPLIQQKWIYTYLKNRTFKTIYETETSEEYPIRAGVPQGSKIGPLLYLLYTCDLRPKATPSLFVGTYADDTIFIAAGRTREKATSKLQQATDQFLEYAKAERIKINAGKTEVIELSLRHRSLMKKPAILQVDGVPISAKPSAKYLGVCFDNHLNFEHHIRAQIKKVTQRFNCLKTYLPSTPQTRGLWKLLYRTTMRPILTYSSASFAARLSQEATKEVQVRERAILRYIYSQPRRTPIPKLYQEAQIADISDHLRTTANIQILQFRNHQDPLIQQIANYDRHDYTFRRPGDLTATDSDSDTTMTCTSLDSDPDSSQGYS